MLFPALLKKHLENADFKNIVLELIEFGIHRYNEKYY